MLGIYYVHYMYLLINHLDLKKEKQERISVIRLWDVSHLLYESDVVLAYKFLIFIQPRYRNLPLQQIREC